jgi:hypothetical protein
MECLTWFRLGLSGLDASTLEAHGELRQLPGTTLQFRRALEANVEPLGSRAREFGTSQIFGYGARSPIF